MKKKTILGLGLAVLLAGGAFAYSMNGNKGQCDGSFGGNKSEMMQGDFSHKEMSKYMKSGQHKGMYGHKKFGKQNGIRNIISQLNLSDEQKTKLFELRKSQMKNTRTINSAFSKTSFNKAKFIEIISQKKENMLKSKAQMIENAYAILNTKQKEQLKVLLDLQIEKRQNRFK